MYCKFCGKKLLMILCFVVIVENKLTKHLIYQRIN